MHGYEQGPVTRRLADDRGRDALEQRELHKAKMEALASLISGIAHEINSPLGALCASADTLRRAAERIEEPGETAEAKQRAAKGVAQSARNVVDASHRLESVMRALQDFANVDRASESFLDVRDSIDNALMFVRYRLQDRIHVEKDLGDVPPLFCRPAELNLVLVNLLHNAIDAIDGEGEIRIRTRRTGDVIEISICDNGRGIAPEDRQSLFQPNFATKQERVRAGLGLGICCKIITSHRGALEVASQPGRGTTITILLPVVGSAHDLDS